MCSASCRGHTRQRVNRLSHVTNKKGFCSVWPVQKPFFLEDKKPERTNQRRQLGSLQSISIRQWPSDKRVPNSAVALTGPRSLITNRFKSHSNMIIKSTTYISVHMMAKPSWEIHLYLRELARQAATCKGERRKKKKKKSHGQ
jgi:hypothetical protein